MLERSSDLSPERQAAFEEFVLEGREQVFDGVQAMLDDVGEPTLAQRVYELAFTPNDVLPKRSRRPELHSALLAVAAADAFDLPESDRTALLEFTVAIQEYYDILDDLIDGDVAEGHENEVQLVAQVLFPLAVARLGRLGGDAVGYWTDCALELVAAPHAEAAASPSPEAYRDLVDRQSVLFGFVPGLAAVAAGREEAAVERAEELGRTIYRHGQFVRDYEQYVGTDDDPWNAAALLGEQAVIEHLEEWRGAIDDLTASYPESARRQLRALVALDVDTWQQALVDG